MKKIIIPLSILILIALSIFLYINRFTDYTVVEVDGYAFNSNTLYSNLYGEEDKDKVSLQTVNVNEIIYKSNNNYYVGEEKKKSINLEYPIVSNDSSTLYIASDIGEFIADDFTHEMSYAGTLITDAKLYNTSDYEQATDYSYYFVRLNNGIYINLNEINIKSYSYDIKIPVNSFVNFKESSLNYYYLNDGEYIYKSYPIVNRNDKVTMSDFDDTYGQLLYNLTMIRNPELDDDENNKDNDKDNQNENENGEGTGEPGEGTISSETGESAPEYIEKEEYTKPEKVCPDRPEVSISGTYAKTYSYRGVIAITDPCSMISKSPTLEIVAEDGQKITKSVGSKGAFTIIGLKPSTNYTVTAAFEYKNKEGKTAKRVIYFDGEKEDKFTTESIDKLNPLEISIGSVTTDINSFFAANIQLNNEEGDEVLNGLSSVTIKTGENNFAFSTSQVKYLANLVKLDYISAKVLKSNTEYNAVIEIKDTAGNILRAHNDTFDFKTKQKPPVISLDVETTSNFKEATLKVTRINNPDNVEVSRYYYNVYDDKGNLFVSNAQIFERQEKYSILNLEPAKKYTVKAYANYTTSDGYTYNDVEIGSRDFFSFDIKNIKNLRFRVEKNLSRPDNITDSAASLKVTPDEEGEVYDLIDPIVTFNVVEVETGEVAYFTKLEKSAIAEGGVIVDIYYDDPNKKLKSNTEYRVTIDATITSGENIYDVRTSINEKGFTFNTLKMEPYVSLSNVYVANGYVDLDATVIDVDQAILDMYENPTDSVVLEVRNRYDEKVYSSSLEIVNNFEVKKDETNPEEEEEDENAPKLKTKRIRLNNLSSDDGPFSFNFSAIKYDDNKTSGSNKLIKGSTSIDVVGLDSTIEIQQVIKASNYYHNEGENLFDLSDLARWRSTEASDVNTFEKMLASIENNTIELESYNGWRAYSYYLPELYDKTTKQGLDVVLSFKAKLGHEDHNSTICVLNGTVSSNGGAAAIKSNRSAKCAKVLQYGTEEDGGVVTLVSSDLNSEDFSEIDPITFKMHSSGYITFLVFEPDNSQSGNSLILKDFRIEVGTEPTNGENTSDNSNYFGQFISTVGNTNATSTTEFANKGDYRHYVSLILCKNARCSEEEDYERTNVDFELAEEYKLAEFSNIKKNFNYKIAYSVLDSTIDRYYDLEVIDFKTDSEIRIIENITDFFNMHQNGYYIAKNDLDFYTTNSAYGGSFNGTLDMQGHKIIWYSNANGKSKRSYLFHTLGGGATLKNVDARFYLNHTSAHTWSYGLVYANYGRMENIMVTLEESMKLNNYVYSLINYVNYGTIENFVIHCKVPLYGLKYMSLGTRYNYGIMRNGYAYADEGVYGIDVSSNISSTDGDYKTTGVFAMQAEAGSILENVYSTIRINIGSEPGTKDLRVGSIVSNVSSATIRNAFVYDDTNLAESARDLNRDVMFGYTNGNGSYANLYYISENLYKEDQSTLQQVTALKNVNFLNQTINDDNKFLTNLAWRLDIFPQLEMPDYMPPQDQISLPDLSDSGLKFITVDSIEYLNDSKYVAKVTVSFHNPNEVIIQSLQIDGIGNEFEGIPTTNADKITTIRLKLKNPTEYKSVYKLTTVTTPAGNIIPINANMIMDIYQRISSLNEIKKLNSNYILTEDIDCSVKKCDKLGTYTGKLNGGGYTISNLTPNDCFINLLQGTLENVNIVNFANKNAAYRVGLICRVEKNGKVKNVHVRDIRLKSSNNNSDAYMGGITGQIESGSVIDSSVINMSVDASTLTESAPEIGGISGYGGNAIIENSFVRNMNVDVNAKSNDYAAIGGIIGRFGSGKIKNVYTTGNITSNINCLGGVVGRGTGSTAGVDSAISNVNINSNQDYLGGIDGYHVSQNVISKTLVLGNLATAKGDALYFDRTSGTAIVRGRNYAWNKQSLNNVITLDTRGEQLLTQEELWTPNMYSTKIGFDNKWELGDKFVEGYIPRLKDSNGVILKNQGYYEDETDDDMSDLRILYEELFELDSATIDESRVRYFDESHSGDLRYASSYAVKFVFKNEKEYVIDRLEFSNNDLEMDVSHPVRTSTDTPRYDEELGRMVNYTEIIYYVTPHRYYDNYTISKIYYKDENNEPQDEDVSIIVNLPFYKRLTSATDWANIEKGYFQNYLVDDTSNMDLTSLNNNIAQLYNKSFNRLVGVGDNKIVIKNISGSSTKGGESVIDTLVSELTNIKFEHINISNSSLGNYCGFIKYLNGSMTNVDFDDVTVNSYQAAYVGIISVNQSPEIRNIKVTNVDILGRTYVGFIGKSNPNAKSQISLKNVNITAQDNLNKVASKRSTGDRSYYVGAFYGYEPWREKGVYATYISGENIDVNNEGTGENTGGLFGYGTGSEILITNSSVHGANYVGGMSGRPSNRNVINEYVVNVDVTGNDIVGGLSGGGSYYPSYSVVYNSRISGNTQIGGIYGYSSGYSTSYVSSFKNTVSGVSSVGGIMGRTSTTTIYYAKVRDTDITATDGKAGGILGSKNIYNLSLYYNTVKANITAGNSAGGLIGHVENEDSRYHTYFRLNLISGSTIEAGDYAGGLIGRANAGLKDSDIQSEYVEAYIKCTYEDASNCGYVMGSGDANGKLMDRLWIYEASTLNGKKFSKYTNQQSLFKNNYSGMATYPMIKTANFYVNNNTGNKLRISSYFNYTNDSLQSYYPRPNLGQTPDRTLVNVFNIMPDKNISQSGILEEDRSLNIKDYGFIPLPSDPSLTQGVGNLSLGTASVYHELPTANVYVSSVDTINIDFSDVDDYSVFSINDGIENYIENRTYTFKYDFNSDIKLVITDGNKVREYKFTKDDLINKISVIENNFYHIKDNKIVSNDETINIDNAINLYNNLVLLSDNRIYDIDTKEYTDNEIVNLEAVETIPLYRFNYLDEEIETYYLYSIVNGVYYDGQLFVKNGELEIIDRDLNNKKDRLIMDKYNDKKYLLYLNDMGVINSLKETIKCPDEFINYNIVDISSNINTNTDILFVLFEDDNYIVFNYKTGTLIASDYSNKPDIFSYVLTNYNAMINGVDLGAPANANYKEAENLAVKLNEASIDTVLSEGEISKSRVGNQDGEKSSYTIKYDAKNNTYEVFELAETKYNEDNENKRSVIITQISNPSADEVISKSDELKDYYNINLNTKKYKPDNEFATVILVMIAAIITVSIAILGNLVIRKIKFRRV